MAEIELNVTDIFWKNYDAYSKGIRRIVNKGGTSSSKTFSLLQILLWIARNKQGTTISVVSETLPHLKLGAIRDFERILKSIQWREGYEYSEANHIYTIGKSIIEFFSADSGKATGPRRDILFLNECNNIPYKVVSELEQRTSETIFYDFNPVEVFWIEDKVLSLPQSEYKHIKSNYLDNHYLPESIGREIELKASRDANYRRVHIEVEYGVYEGLIFTDWKMCDELPPSQKQIYGMDFGFTNDPTTLIDIRLHDGQLWFDELLYRTAMTNQDIISFLKSMNIGRAQIIADSSEPKSIHEIELAGFNITGADKGKDSIRAGIDRIKSYPINVTKRSVNLIKELRSYKWKTDRNGNSINEPMDYFNHAIDAMRYGTMRISGAPLRPAKFTFHN